MEQPRRLLVMGASCVFAFRRSFLSEFMITEPLDARVNREDQVFAAASICTAFQSIKSNGEAYKSIVPDSVHGEAFPPAISAGSVPHNHRRSITATTDTETLKTSRQCKVSHAFPFDPKITGVQPGLYKNHCQLNGPSSSELESLYAGEVSCAGCVRCKDQSNISPKLLSKQPCDATITGSENYTFWPLYLYQQNPVTSMPYINDMAEVGNGTLPFVDTTVTPPQLDGTHLPCYEVAACNLCWSKLRSRAMMESYKLMKQQLCGQWRSPVTPNAPPLDHGSLRSLKGVSESFSLSAKADRNTGLDGPNFITSPTPCKQMYGISHHPIINIPKCISIRADSPIQQQKTDVRVASHAVTGHLPTEHYKLYHHHHFTRTTTDVQEQTKVVALAENLTCLAFPQGMYKTEMCNKWARSMGQYCPYGDKCQFAHGPQELRPVLRHHRYKTILCRMVAAGEPCPYEHRCHFRHVVYPQEAALLGLNTISDSAWSTSK